MEECAAQDEEVEGEGEGAEGEGEGDEEEKKRQRERGTVCSRTDTEQLCASLDDCVSDTLT